MLTSYKRSLAFDPDDDGIIALYTGCSRDRRRETPDVAMPASGNLSGLSTDTRGAGIKVAARCSNRIAEIYRASLTTKNKP